MKTALRLFAVLGLLAGVAGCPGDKEKGGAASEKPAEKSVREEVVDTVGHAPSDMARKAEQRVNAAVNQAADRLDQAADTEGGW